MEFLASTSPPVAKRFDFALISDFKDNAQYPGCRNIRRGGDGLRDDFPGDVYVYAVFAHVGIRRAWFEAQVRRQRLGMLHPEKPTIPPGVLEERDDDM